MARVDVSFEQVSLHMQANSLPLVSTTFSRSLNSFVVLFATDKATGNLAPIGFTEVIQGIVDPTWSQAFTVDYNFEMAQEFILRVYHHSGSHDVKELNRHKLVGGCNFKLSQLMRAHEQKLVLTLPDAPGATLTVRGESLANTRDNFQVSFSCARLSNKEGFFSTSDPFIQISRLNEDGNWTVVWKNKHIDNTLNPVWAEVKIPMAILCNGDIDRPLRLEIFDYEKSGKHVFMGQVETNVRQMLMAQGRTIDVIEPAKKSKNKKYINSGTLSAGKAAIEHNPTFGDFIMGKMEISVIAGIDFTSSNGDPTNPTSLHYQDGAGRENPYQYAIRSIIGILEPYDTDQMYPVYGFGAKVRLPDNTLTAAQHCFPIYEGSKEADSGLGGEVKGVDGVLQAYRDALQVVMLSGPTLFAPLINHAASIAHNANCNQQNQKYFILLILTDGVINDIDLTKEAVIRASQLPLSIIIVGVGEADFSAMRELDSDDGLLTHHHQTACRDIVQFVALREHMSTGKESLAQSVLAEVPSQVLIYMKQHSIVPNTPRFQQSGKA